MYWLSVPLADSVLQAQLYCIILVLCSLHYVQIQGTVDTPTRSACEAADSSAAMGVAEAASDSNETARASHVATKRQYVQDGLQQQATAKRSKPQQHLQEQQVDEMILPSPAIRPSPQS